MKREDSQVLQLRPGTAKKINMEEEKKKPVKVIKKKESLRNCHSQEEPKWTWQPTECGIPDGTLEWK